MQATRSKMILHINFHPRLRFSHLFPSNFNLMIFIIASQLVGISCSVLVVEVDIKNKRVKTCGFRSTMQKSIASGFSDELICISYRVRETAEQLPFTALYTPAAVSVAFLRCILMT